MAYDSKLYLHDPAVSASLWIGGNTYTSGSNSTSPILLPGVPLRGLNLNMVLNSVLSTPALEVHLWEGVSTGATHYLFRSFPTRITAVGEYNMRFHLDKGYYSLKAQYSFSAVAASSGCGFPGAIIRVGMDGGAQGNAY
jgi:hypothetical protein